MHQPKRISGEVYLGRGERFVEGGSACANSALHSLEPSPSGSASSAEVAPARPEAGDRSRFGTFSECPQCAGSMQPEHAHFRCGSCGWRDSCCD
jgi:hypothetical protein